VKAHQPSNTVPRKFAIVLQRLHAPLPKAIWNVGINEQYERSLRQLSYKILMGTSSEKVVHHLHHRSQNWTMQEIGSHIEMIL